MSKLVDSCCFLRKFPHCILLLKLAYIHYCSKTYGIYNHDFTNFHRTLHLQRHYFIFLWKSIYHDVMMSQLMYHLHGKWRAGRGLVDREGANEARGREAAAWESWTSLISARFTSDDVRTQFLNE